MPCGCGACGASPGGCGMPGSMPTGGCPTMPTGCPMGGCACGCASENTSFFSHFYRKFSKVFSWKLNSMVFV